MPIPRITKGTCYAVFAYDLGFQIDLDKAERLVSTVSDAGPHRGTLRHERRAPKYFEAQPLPLCVTRATAPVRLGGMASNSAAEAVFYDFGVLAITYTIPLAGPLETLLDLTEALYENPTLLADSRRLASDLLGVIRPAIDRAGLSLMVEDYFVVHLAAVEGMTSPAELIETNRGLIARVLRSERGEMSGQEIDDALGVQLSYSPSDAAVVDWNASLLIGPAEEDSVAVLRFANVELLEMRFLDEQLDRALSQAYEAAQRRAGLKGLLSHRTAADMRRIASFQVDSAMLFEGVNNALKLLGDQYLARLYRLAGQRLHLPDWDASILRKLDTLADLYQKVADRQTNRRMEVLEWIIILLIMFEIVMSLVR